MSLHAIHIEGDTDTIGNDLSKCALKIAMKFAVEVAEKVTQTANEHMIY